MSHPFDAQIARDKILEQMALALAEIGFKMGASPHTRVENAREAINELRRATGRPSRPRNPNVTEERL